MPFVFLSAQSKALNIAASLFALTMLLSSFAHADAAKKTSSAESLSAAKDAPSPVPSPDAASESGKAVQAAAVSSTTTNARALQDLVLTTDPAHVVLTEGGQVQLTIASAAGKLDPKDLQLFSNVGKFDEASADDMGQLVVNYHLPTKLYPQVVLLAALVRIDGVQQLGWIALPLFGRGEMELEGKRRHKLSIKIGDQVFGPVRANRKGKATVKIEVPPGYEFGYVKKTKIPLGVVPFSRLLVLAEKPSVQASHDAKTAEATTLHVFAVNKRGQALQNAEFVIETSAGQAMPVQAVKAGHYKFALQAVDVSPEQPIKVSVHLKDSPDFVSEVSLKVLKAAPVVVAQKKVDKQQPEQGAELDWTLISAGAGAAALAVGGIAALALESTLSLSALGSADDRDLMQGSERAMLGLATAGLLTSAVGGGLYLMNNTN